MRDMDRRTIADYGVPGQVLMERAGSGAAWVASSMLAGVAQARVVVVCGRGNNGGDGFVVARLLGQLGHAVSVFSCVEPATIVGDARSALERLLAAGRQVTMARDPGLRDALGSADLVVDGLLGTGIAGEVREPFRTAIAQINSAGRPVLSLDIPSGLCSDTGMPLGVAVAATATATFGLPKPGLLLYPGARLAGRIVCVDIGIPEPVMAAADLLLLESRDVVEWLPQRAPDSHKGDAGRVLVVAGSTGLTGAACLTARACCRTGAGLVTVAAPRAVCPSIEARTLESMTWPLDGSLEHLAETSVAGILERSRHVDALAVGPGLGREDQTMEAVRLLIGGLDRPVVVDADALFALSGHHHLTRGRLVVLTPHPGEMARLLGTSAENVQADRVGAACDAAKRYGCTVLLKGAGSVIAEPDGRVAINPTGHSGMASGGMGDVLTGVVAALLGQGLAPFESAAAGAFLHGYAATLAADDLGGEIGILAGDVADRIPRALARVTACCGPRCPVKWLGEHDYR